jgi:hypothetical protein
MPSGRDSFRRNRVAPNTSYFTTLRKGARELTARQGHCEICRTSSTTRLGQKGLLLGTVPVLGG